MAGGQPEFARAVARLAIEAGLTLCEACEHSLAQLDLLAHAARTRRAADLLAQAQILATCIAAPFGRDASRALQRLIDDLAKDA